MSTTSPTVYAYFRVTSASHFNRDQFDDLIKPSLFNLLSHRAEAARELLKVGNSEDRHKELIDYYNYIDLQISELLSLPTPDKSI